MTEDERIISERDDAAMIDRPDLWPLGDKLPLKKPGEVFGGGLGFMLVGHGYVVYIGIMRLPNATSKQYDSAAAIVADGWIVD